MTSGEGRSWRTALCNLLLYSFRIIFNFKKYSTVGIKVSIDNHLDEHR